jgi:hypothetical protein
MYSYCCCSRPAVNKSCFTNTKSKRYWVKETKVDTDAMDILPSSLVVAPSLPIHLCIIIVMGDAIITLFDYEGICFSSFPFFGYSL